jgi:hypothetical protein
MAQAIGYTLNQWAELNVLAADGAVPIDNNVSEREMKRVVLNRNYVHRRIMCSVSGGGAARIGCCGRLRCRQRFAAPHNPDAFLPPNGQRKRHASAHATARRSLRTAA